MEVLLDFHAVPVSGDEQTPVGGLKPGVTARWRTVDLPLQRLLDSAFVFKHHIRVHALFLGMHFASAEGKETHLLKQEMAASRRV